MRHRMYRRRMVVSQRYQPRIARGFPSPLEIEVDDISSTVAVSIRDQTDWIRLFVRNGVFRGDLATAICIIGINIGVVLFSPPGSQAFLF